MADNEAEWLAKAQQGDAQAFSKLVEAYQVPVYNLCYRMLSNSEDAEDAAQETFLRAYKAIKRYDPQRKFSTWLLSIASNYCIDRYRRRRLPSTPIESMPQGELPDGAPSIESTVARHETQGEIQVLLEVLNPHDRAAVIMRYWYEYSYEEIAEELDLSISAVKSRLHRARRALAAEWLDRQPEAPALGVERSRHGSPAF